MKSCSKCGIPKDEIEFSRDRSKSDGLNAQCRSCKKLIAEDYKKRRPIQTCESSKKYRNKPETTAYRKKWKNDHPDRVQLAVLKSRLKTKYGLTLEQYQAMLDRQGGRCAICHREPTGPNKADRILHVDHDHGTNRVRGLLCNPCNIAIGLMEDDPTRLISASTYLTETETKELNEYHTVAP